jgi:deoxyribodipyrimidine photo-lyase
VSATIVWFRNDLRTADNRALAAAVQRKEPVLPVFIWAPQEQGDWPLGTSSRWWLRRSLAALAAELTCMGSKLIVRTGRTVEILAELAEETAADVVYFSREYDAHSVQLETAVAAELGKSGVILRGLNNSLLMEPWELQNSSGSAFRVFTPYWKRAITHLEAVENEPIEKPATIDGAAQHIRSLAIDSLELSLEKETVRRLESSGWSPGETSASEKLHEFVSEKVHSYAADRDRLDVSPSSVLAPHLRFGEISPRQIWRAVKEGGAAATRNSVSDSAFLRQLIWREFAYHLLYHFPESTSLPLQSKFDSSIWHDDAELFNVWKEGRTGYPIVDAGMRQLRQTGWISNRMRMVVASFLVKDLLIPWQRGAHWFWETLVDADLANNTFGWQWVSGCGADAAPFFRIFNPVTQGQKFDPTGEYTRRWVPELRKLPASSIHQPWKVSASVLEEAGVLLRTDYPAPIIDHDFARRRALEAIKR